MDKSKNPLGINEGEQPNSARTADTDREATGAPDCNNSPPLDVLEVRQLIIRDSAGTPRIVLGMSAKDEPCIEVKASNGVTKIEITVDNESRADIGLQNGKGEHMHMWGYDDELGLEFTGRQGFPRFYVNANDDAGILAAFCPQAKDGKDPEGVGIVLGMDVTDRPVMQIGD